MTEIAHYLYSVHNLFSHQPLYSLRVTHLHSQLVLFSVLSYPPIRVLVQKIHLTYFESQDYLKVFFPPR